MKKLTALLAASAAVFSLTISGYAADVIPENYNGYVEYAAFGENIQEDIYSSEDILVSTVTEDRLSENTDGEASGTIEDESGFSMQDLLKKLLISLVVGVVIALIICFIMKSMMKTANPKSTANDYIRKNSFNISRSRDIFIYANVTKKKRVKEENTK